MNDKERTAEDLRKLCPVGTRVYTSTVHREHVKLYVAAVGDGWPVIEDITGMASTVTGYSWCRECAGLKTAYRWDVVSNLALALHGVENMLVLGKL